MVDKALPVAGKAAVAAGGGYALYDISSKSVDTAREQGALMGVAQAGKTAAQHASAGLWFAFGASIALTLATGGLASPLLACTAGALITTGGIYMTNRAIEDATQGLK